MSTKVRSWLVVAIVVLEALLWFSTPAPARAENTLLTDPYGVACVAFTSIWANDDSGYVVPTVGSWDVVLKCNLKPSTSTHDTWLSNLASGSLASSCGAWFISCGVGGGTNGEASSVGLRTSGSYASHGCNDASSHTQVVNHGPIKNSSGTTIASGTSGFTAVNHLVIRVRCKPLAGGATRQDLAVNIAGFTTPGFYTTSPYERGESNACGEVDGGPSGFPFQVCYGTDDSTTWNTTAIWPDYWAESAPTATACAGTDFLLYEDGVLIGDTISTGLGVARAERGKRYTLRLNLPAALMTGETFTLYFTADRNSVNARPVASMLLPASGTSVRQFDVSNYFATLDDPTPLIANLQAICQTNRTAGSLYWNGESDTTDDPFDPTKDPPDGLEGDWGAGDDAGCFEFDGLSLTNPITWVRAIGVMSLCLAELAFVPDSEAVATAVEDTVEFFQDTFPFSLGYLAVEAVDSFADGISGGASCFDIDIDVQGAAASPCMETDAVTLGGTMRTILVSLLYCFLMLGLIELAWGMVKT